MNIAAILPRLLPFGFQPWAARLPEPTTEAAGPVQRTLPRRAVMALENRPLQLRVLRGWIWITRDGCPVDLVLSAGEVFEQRPGARVLVQALEEVEFSIAAAGASAQNA